jgi:hypothetical protein
VAGGQGRPAGAEHERIGGQQCDLLDRGERGGAGQRRVDVARLAHRADVARGGDHGHVTARGRLERGVHALRLRAGHAVLAADLPGGADRDDAAFGAAEAQRGDGGGDCIAGRAAAPPPRPGRPRGPAAGGAALRGVDRALRGGNPAMLAP